MARVRMHRVVIRATTQREAFQLVNQVMYEVHAGAFVAAQGGAYSTGNLAASLFRDGPHITPLRITGEVGSNLPYAAAVHNGAKVHWIFPKGAVGRVRFGSRKRPQLKFFWRKAGRVVYMPHIPGSPGKIGRSHPGQKGKHYLTGPLRRSARIHGFRVVVYDV
jgi:hypothetical protein